MADPPFGMPTIRTVATLVAGLVTLSKPVHGQANDGRPERLLEARVDSLMAKHTAPSTPGAAVLVVQDGQVLLKKGYGLAVIEQRTPIRADTRFLLASVSKQFTAMAIMILAERGKLSYDDRLSKFFPEFPPYADSITVRRLLNHVAGFPEYEELFMETGKVDRNWPRASSTPPSAYEPTAHDALEFLASKAKLRFRPGDRYEYSNSGYMILGQIIEKVSGQRYARFLGENIFAPLGMTETAVYDETKPAIPNRASSYRKSASGAYEQIDYTPFNAIYGEDNVVTTLGDLYRWDQALYTEQLVHESTLRMAFTPGRLNDGSRTEYGFGWQLRPVLGLPTTSHTGSWMGFRTVILRFPEKHTTVVVLANTNDLPVGAVVQEVAAIYLEGRR
jgi:CubicO group peptidase (beta-lactamase class C family)